MKTFLAKLNLITTLIALIAIFLSIILVFLMGLDESFSSIDFLSYTAQHYIEFGIWMMVPMAIGLRLQCYRKANDPAGCRTSAEMWEKLNRRDAGSLSIAALAFSSPHFSQTGNCVAASLAAGSRAYTMYLLYAGLLLLQEHWCFGQYGRLLQKAYILFDCRSKLLCLQYLPRFSK